ncbi:flagellar protein FlaG [Larsenimonas rhizosphaerae]|uniref:flagellar protein FlaG n=1 Tax=Larsenimonas rhizosphaerae TaxID=2944682 RepID=UPI002033B142|nr:flagellar protein FlaG [Larsenimonas rhizosphaerae]MCM2130420.1 flagellar protein FlaG [Larsenimonas rhizosphaerae]
MTSAYIPPASPSIATSALLPQQATHKPDPAAPPDRSSLLLSEDEKSDTSNVTPETLDELNALLEGYSVQFEINDDIDRMVVKLVDKTNGEVVRQIPSEEMVNIIQRMKEGTLQMINTEA